MDRCPSRQFFTLAAHRGYNRRSDLDRPARTTGERHERIKESRMSLPRPESFVEREQTHQQATAQPPQQQAPDSQPRSR